MRIISLIHAISAPDDGEFLASRRGTAFLLPATRRAAENMRYAAGMKTSPTAVAAMLQKRLPPRASLISMADFD